MIEIYPFKMSNNKVTMAKDFFPVLKTFVVPMFPEPIFRMSFPKNTFVIISPNGIEPRKYE